MTFSMHRSLVTTTALSAMGIICGASPALALPANLTVSAPDPGEEQTVSTDSTYTSILVGTGAGESGTLTVAPGVTLNTGGVDDSVGGAIGQVETATGKVIVSGTDAKWIDSGNHSIIWVGQDGTGSIEVSNGGSLETRRVFLAPGATGNGTVTVSGQGSSWVNAEEIHIGYNGTGTVTISDGATVQTARTFIGQKEGSLTLEGTGTRWFSQFGGQIGRETDSVSGTLLIKDGATFEAYEEGLYVSKGSVTVTGEGSQLLVGTEHPEPPSTWAESDGWFSLGGSGEGATVLITDGGVVNADGTHMSNDNEDYSSITVSGAGSKLINNLSLYIGGGGNNPDGSYAEVIITDGGYVSAFTAATGTDLNGSGFVRISGEGSMLDVQGNEYFSGNMRVGYEGGGEVVVQNGGLLKTANVLDIASLETSTGLLIIGAAEGDAAEAAGTVEAANGLFFGLGDARLVFNHTDTDYEFDTAMSGEGGEILHLAGVTNFTGDSSGYAGTLDVSGGSVYANGDLSGADVTIGSGALLGGSGSVGSIVVNSGGTLSTGNSPGVLTVSGDVLFETGSNFDIELASALYDGIYVETGDVTIEDGALLNILEGAEFLLENPYPIIEIAEGSDGEIIVEGDGFIVSAEQYDLLETLVGYEDGLVTVTYQGKSASWSDFLATANQGATANALQALGKDSDLYKSAVFLTKDEMADVISSLSGEVHASVKSALIEESYLVRSLAMDHAGQGGTGLSIWANAFGNWGSQDGNDNAAGIDRDSAGVFMGAEVGLTNWNIGVLAGYGSMDIDLDSQASSAEADSFHLGAFAGGSLGKLNLRAGVSQSWHDISTSRTALFPGSQALVADYDGTTTQVFGELGYSLKVPGASLEPFVGLAHVSLDTDAFTESGGEAALRGEEMTTTVNYSTVGLRGSTGVDAVAAGVSIRGMLGWQHAFDDDLPSARLMFADSTSAFGVTGAPISEDALLAEAGLDVTLSPGMTLNLSYKGRYGNEGNDSAALGGLSIGF